MEIDNLDQKLTDLYNRLSVKEKERFLKWLAFVEILRDHAKDNNLMLSIDQEII